MIFLPYALDMVPEKFDWVLVDEAQDLNAAQRWLVQQGRANGGRMIFVGDSRQAIMGFAGADTSSFFKIQQETEATMLPLSICWRCPSTHLNMARLIVPSIEDRPNAPEGTIAAIHEASATKAIQEAVTKSQEGGVLVLSRTTAPLVGLCIKLIKSRVAARVRGRDIAKGLVELAQTCGKMTGIDFLDALELHERKQVEKLSRKPGNENRIDTLHDKCEALQVCWTEFNVSTVAELCREIENIFSDERPTVWLSTIHRAKGLEAEQVFIVNPSKLPFTHPKQGPEDAVQEANICYVALTRSTNSMTFIFQDEEEVPENYMDYIAL
jgi:DNA helicase-2/ATP-dependent DNA helicase PcrA